MVKWLNGGTIRLLLPVAALAFAGPASHAVPAAAQESTAQQASATDGQGNIPRFGLRGIAGETETAQADDPFNDSPILPVGGTGQNASTNAASGATGSQDTGFDNPAATSSGDASSGDNAVNQASAAYAPIPLTRATQGRERPEQRQSPVLDPINTATPDTRANLRAQPIEAGTPRPQTADPFLPPGFRAGTWQVFTRLEQAIGYSTNNTFAAGGKPGAFSQTDANITMRSDWSRHAASIEATGSLRRALGTGDETIPSAGIAGNLRLDLLDGVTANLQGKYNYTTESLSSTSLVSGVARRPAVHEYGGSAELTRSGGKLDFTLRGSADRTTHADAQLAGGGVLSQADRYNTLYQVSARAAYGPTPSIKPFVQGGVGWRVYDHKVDRNGDRRSGLLYDLRGGVELDLHDKLKGEIAVGYAAERFDSDSLKTLDGLTVNGTLDWSPHRDTNIKLTATTAFGGSTTAGDNGSLNYNLLAQAVRRVRDNLAVNATASYGLTYYDTTGTADHDYKIGTGIEYWVSRYLSLTADLEYERFESATPGSSWDATSIRVGVALQR